MAFPLLRSLTLCCLLIGFTLPALAAGEREPLTIESDKGTHQFLVEVADTPEEKAHGLMFREAMDQDQGMLFLMDGLEPARMWMKNTPLPLDMIFTGSGGYILSIASDTKPYSLDIISAPAPTAAVLEVKAGTAARLGIKPGDRIVHPLINPLNRP